MTRCETSVRGGCARASQVSWTHRSQCDGFDDEDNGESWPCQLVEFGLILRHIVQVDIGEGSSLFACTWRILGHENLIVGLAVWRVPLRVRVLVVGTAGGRSQSGTFVRHVREVLLAGAGKEGTSRLSESRYRGANVRVRRMAKVGGAKRIVRRTYLGRVR